MLRNGVETEFGRVGAIRRVNRFVDFMKSTNLIAAIERD